MAHTRRLARGMVLCGLLACVAGAGRAQEEQPLPRSHWYRAVLALYDAGAYDDAIAALGLLKSYRTRAFLDAQAFDSLAGLPPEAAAAQRALDAEYSATVEALLGAGSAEEARKGLAASSDVAARQGKLAAMRLEGSRAADLPSREPRLFAPNTLPANVVVLCAIDAGDRVLLTLSKSTQPTLGYEVAEPAALTARLAAWAERLAAGEEDRSESMALRSALLGPLADPATKAQRLLIVPDGRLFRVPLGALRTDDGSPLGARVECIHAVSLSQYALAMRRASGGGLSSVRTAALCDPLFVEPGQAGAAGRGYVYVPVSRGAKAARAYAYVPPPGIRGGEGGVVEIAPVAENTMAGHFAAKGATLTRLGRTLREAEGLCAVAGEGSRALQGLRASETQARQRLAEEGIVHLATCTLWDEENPFLSSAVLSPDPEHDGYLSALEVLGLSVKAGLVVLPVARWCPGDPVEGDGISALVWALTIAGSPRTLLSVTRATDGDGGAFTKTLYTALAAGQSPGGALRGAIAATSEEPSETAYRAGAALYGAP